MDPFSPFLEPSPASYFYPPAAIDSSLSPLDPTTHGYPYQLLGGPQPGSFQSPGGTLPAPFLNFVYQFYNPQPRGVDTGNVLSRQLLLKHF